MWSKILAPQDLEVPSGLCGAVLAGVYGNTVPQPFLPTVIQVFSQLLEELFNNFFFPQRKLSCV